MRRASAGLVGLAALLALTPGPNPAQAAPLPASQSAAQQCIARGEIYVLAVSESGAVIASGCAGRVSTGEQALRAVASVQERRADRGFVCQINGSPGQCIEGKDFARFGQRYWQYFHGTPGGGWSYSQRGYANYAPAPGSVEGWCYGQTGVGCPQRLAAVVNLGGLSRDQPAPTTAAPRTSAVQTPRTTRRPQVTPPGSPGQPHPGHSRPARTTTLGPTGGSTSQPATRAGASPSSPRSPGVSPTSSAPASSGSSAPASPGGSTSASAGPSSNQPGIGQPPGGTDNGTPWGAAVTGSLVVLVAAGYGIVRVRRRRSDDQP